MHNVLIGLLLMAFCSCGGAERQAVGVVEEPTGNNIGKALSDCDLAVRNAKNDFASGIYSFHSEPFYPPECTYCDVLRMDYNIGWYFTTGDFSKQYWECYDSTLTVDLKEKYGKDFLQRAREKADSLDKSGKWNNEASFMGGLPELNKYFKSVSLKLSCLLKEPTDSTTIVVGFTILPSGASTNVQILRGINKEVDSAAIEIIEQIIKQVPNWKPGYRRGKPTPVKYTIPIKIGKEKTKPANNG